MYLLNIVVVIVIIDSQNWTTYVFDTYCCENDEGVVVPVAVISSIPMSATASAATEEANMFYVELL
jgi:hypothetical protein